MDLGDHFRVIWNRRWIVLVATLVIAGAVFAWRFSRPDVFEADAALSVVPGESVAVGVVAESESLFLADRYAELATARSVIDDARRRSGLSLSADEAEDRISADASDEAGYITITATGPSVDDATALARAEVDALLDSVRSQHEEVIDDRVAPIEEDLADVEDRLLEAEPAAANLPALEARYDALLQALNETRLQPGNRIVEVSPAQGDPDPVSPRPVRDTAFALLAALVVNSELAVAFAWLTDRFSRSGGDLEVADVTGLPLLARVPVGGKEPMVEAFRTMRTKLMFLDTHDSLRTVSVVSVDPGAGKSYTCVNLARAVAGMGVPVALIDADLRRPRVHMELGVDLSPGLGDVLTGTDVQEALRPVPGEDFLHVIPAGSALADPSGLVGGVEFAKVIDALGWAGLLLIDTPPTALCADGLAVASQCDAALVVVDARTTRRRDARSLIRQLRQVGANPIGVVLNRVERAPRGSYYQRNETDTRTSA